MASQTAGETTDAQEPGGDGEVYSPIVLSEAALIRETALRNGYSEAEARQFEEDFLRASPEDRPFFSRLIYGQLNRVASQAAETARATSEPAENATAAAHDTPVLATRTVDNTSQSGSAGATTHVPAEPSVQETPAGTSTTATATTAISSSATASLTANQPSPGAATHTAALEESPPSAVPGERAGIETGPCSDATAAPAVMPASYASTDAQRQTGPTGVSHAFQSQSSDASNAGPSAPAADAPNEDDENWQRQLQAAIERLQRELKRDGQLNGEQAARLRAQLGLMQLVAAEPEKALEVLKGLDEQELEFWRQTIMGMGILLNADKFPSVGYRIESATEHLDSGLTALSTLGPLRIRNLAFVSSVRSFGDYDEMNVYAFQPGEPAILYVEVENFTMEEMRTVEEDVASTRRRASTTSSLPMYETELHGRYDIYLQDPDPRLVASRTLPVNRDRCRQRRRDYFIPYSLYFPKELKPGHYTLELTIEDKKGEKISTSVLDFRIR